MQNSLDNRVVMTILVLLVEHFPPQRPLACRRAAPAGPREARPLAWGAGAAVPTAGWLMGGASVDGCTFYAVGGNTPGSVAVPNVISHPATDAWTSRAHADGPLTAFSRRQPTRIYVVEATLIFQPVCTLRDVHAHL
ncbi:MAG: hypothetical protein IPO15_21240 [Anaerolineae bacterium]|uniref:hypothetical protein n=1 Tax=Candidatus Amarolinea dominans TaxID=3140696 RepID=UPI003135FA09|nr:hypothetical protein [Anaerolineae bacterium]